MVLLATLAPLTNCAAPQALTNRWVFVRQELRSAEDVARIQDVLVRSARAGYNGVVLQCGFDWALDRDPAYFDRVNRVKQLCDSLGIEPIPLIFTPESAGAILTHDRNLSAVVPVHNATYVVRGGEAQVLTRQHVTNGGMEEYSDNRLAAYRSQDGPGKTTFIDHNVFKSGNTSLRFADFADARGGMGRLTQIVEVDSFRTYRFACWIKTEALGPPAKIIMQARAPDGHLLTTRRLAIEPTSDWQRHVIGFNSLGNERIRVYIGVWDGVSGQMWADDLSVLEAGPLNLIRRDGTPVSVRGSGGREYQERVDYVLPVVAGMDFRFDRPDPSIRIREGSTIQDDDTLTLDYFDALAPDGQPGACPSDSAVFAYWARVLTRVRAALEPRSYFLNTSEVRIGGWCRTCTQGGKTGAEVLGGCFTMQADLIRNVDPEAAIYVWSDMLDPTHNAVLDYWLFRGDLSDTSQHVPHDVTVVCWGARARMGSLQYFERLGFRTMVAAYYDSGSVSGAERWLRVAEGAPGLCGMMYTTWRDDYRYLEPFAELIEHPEQ